MHKKTVYLSDDLLNRIGETKNLSARIIELINEGLEYEAGKINKITLNDITKFFVIRYQAQQSKNTVR